MFPRIQFENLLRAIGKSKLERFKIGSIQTHQHFQILTQSIPSMKLKELMIQWSSNSDRLRNAKEELLQAVKNNFTLLSVKAMTTTNTRDVFDDNDKQTLAFYANRNESLDQWVDNPELVEQQKLWPEALGLAERAGPEALFCGLRSVLERDYVSLPRSRKRKRTQYYTPS